jgi:hypothetical protein
MRTCLSTDHGRRRQQTERGDLVLAVSKEVIEEEE